MGCNCGGSRQAARRTTTERQAAAAVAPARPRGPKSEGYYWTGRNKRAQQDSGSK